MTKQSQREIDEVIEQIVTSYQPEKIILFGSAASGILGQWSDIDLIVIKRGIQKRFSDRIGEMRARIQSPRAIDLLVYTPEEFERLQSESWFVGEEIAKKGKVVYGV